MNSTIQFILILFSFDLMAQTAASIDANVILERADDFRSPASDYLMVVTVETSDQPLYKFEMKVGGKAATLIRTIEPKREIGKNFLMLGEDMWAYIPNIRRPLRVSLSQKLTGQASYGDISRMRWFGDYDSQIESQEQSHWILFLTAKKKGLTYEKIRIWIDKESNRPSKGEYLSLSGRVLKTIEFAEYSAIDGKIRPTKMILRDAGKQESSTILRLLKMEPTEFSSGLFSQDSLR